MNWHLKTKAPQSFFKKFPEFSSLTAQLLYNRGLKTQQQIDEFFNPDFSDDLHDPYLLKDMRKAVVRIKKALKKQEKILIYGDFDADGVCSSAILHYSLKALGSSNLGAYIPNREKENHGLNFDSIKQAAKDKVNLIITVDCGSTDKQEADLAKKLGIDLIITDHHEMISKKPIAEAIINPYQKGEKYPFKHLSGAGVAYKLACALFDEMGDPDNLKKWLLDLTALATVADVMPIIGENRTIVKYGLGVLAQTRWVGLKELMEIAKIAPEIVHPSLNGKAPFSNLDTFTLGFMLAPRLNAPGRINHASLAFELLISQDIDAAKKMALEVNQQNLERQQLADKLTAELEFCLADLKDLPDVIFEGKKDWPIGILGLAASKATEKYQRPVILYCENQDQICASARAIPQFDLITALAECNQYFDDYGGHRSAGGFRMGRNKAKLAQLKKELNQIAKKRLAGIDLNPVLEIDTELSLADFNFSNYEQIQQFAPFGKANPEPIFSVRGLEVLGARLVGNGQKHLKMDLLMFGQGESSRPIKAIGFGLGEYYQQIKSGMLIDAAFKLILNQWNGFKDLEMKIVDLKINS